MLGPECGPAVPLEITFRCCFLLRGSGKEDSEPEQRRLTVLNRIRSMWARLWRRRGRRIDEHEFYDQHEATRYRTLHESRQDGDLPF
jgi:hypothetical protein